MRSEIRLGREIAVKLCSIGKVFAKVECRTNLSRKRNTTASSRAISRVETAYSCDVSEVSLPPQVR
jgi:hypothetical protein